jgi:hypothetical protein
VRLLRRGLTGGKKIGQHFLQVTAVERLRRSL